MRNFFLSLFCLLLCQLSFGQGLERVFVETYYIADREDENGENARGIEAGMVTYRIWVDMKEGYRLLSVFGAPGNPLKINTTTTFFNDTIFGKIQAPEIDPSKLGANALLIDSYIALSGANRSDIAVLKVDDSDGSVVQPVVNPEEPRLIDRGVLLNRNPNAGLPLRDSDGLMDGNVPALVVFGHDFAAFGNCLHQNSVEFDNGAWAVFKGLKGPFSESNYVLVAQVTTDGELSYELNLQLASPQGVTEYYVARNPKEDEFSHPSLVKSPTQPLLLEP
jgi:hypothetical protein